MDGVPRENSAVKVLSALTWFAIIVGVAAAYHNWDSVAPSGHSLIRPVAEPDVESGSSAGGHIAVSPPGKPVGMPAAPLTPTQLTAPPLTLGAGMHSAAVVPLPSVQRPTDVSANGANVGSNEAAAQRGGDGSFVFDAVVNGGHARMIFDTGASAVVLRAEDAAQLGINVTRLNYSTKIKTANGTAEVAPVMIDKLVIGNITQRNVIGVVAKEGTLHENLLGQTFLARLAGLNVENNLLVLRGR